MYIASAALGNMTRKDMVSPCGDLQNREDKPGRFHSFDKLCGGCPKSVQLHHSKILLPRGDKQGIVDIVDIVEFFLQLDSIFAICLCTCHWSAR